MGLGEGVIVVAIVGAVVFLIARIVMGYRRGRAEARSEH